MKKVLLISTILLTASCAQNRNASTVKVPASQTQNIIQTEIIEGKILEVLQGKDGYTAKVNTPKNETYFITISRANLINPTQYKIVNTGEQIKVKGDFWKMNNENHITTREILNNN